MVIHLEFKCPYCATTNRLPVEAGEVGGKQIFLCESEAGGCDDYFAVFWHMRAEINVKRIAA